MEEVKSYGKRILTLSEKILELSYTNSTVRRNITLWRQGKLTYQEAIEICVLELVQYLELLQNRFEMNKE